MNPSENYILLTYLQETPEHTQASTQNLKRNIIEVLPQETLCKAIALTGINYLGKYRDPDNYIRENLELFYSEVGFYAIEYIISKLLLENIRGETKIKLVAFRHELVTYTQRVSSELQRV